MPIPLILAGLSVAAGIIGAGGHISAKEKNGKAQRVSEDAQELYNSLKCSLEREKNNTEKALLRFGYAKKKILDCSMKQFLKSYEKIKSIEVTNSAGLDEISNFAINQEGAIQIREMTDIYSSAITSSATGAAAGAVMVLAANGSLSVVSGVLSMAGSTLAMGEIGAAASMAGSALSFGVSMTPLAALAAPVVLFTGLSASIKADENLEKAQTMCAEATAAAEKMKVSKTLCIAIAERSDMFHELLLELDGMFSECAGMLEAVVQKKSGFLGKKEIKSEELSKAELNLVAVTRALAGAIKSIIDTPILSNSGVVSVESEDIYNQITHKTPIFTKAVKEIESYDYKVKAKEIKQSKVSVPSKNYSNTGMPNIKRNIFAIVLGILAALLFTDTFLKGVLICIIISLLVMKSNGNNIGTKTNSKIQKKGSKFLKKLAIAVCGICLINKLLPSNADITSGPISEYMDKAAISALSVEKAATPIVPTTGVNTGEALITESESGKNLFEEVSTEAGVSSEGSSSAISEFASALSTDELIDFQKEYTAEYLSIKLGITIENAYTRDEITGMGIKDYKAEDGTTYAFIVYSIRHIEGETYLLNSISMLPSLLAPDGSRYKAYPEVTIAARDENGIDSNEYMKDESPVRKATGFCVPKKWIDDNATFYIGREYEENIPIKFEAVSTDAESLTEAESSSEGISSAISESASAVSTDDLIDFQKEYIVEYLSAKGGITIENTYTRDEITGMGICDYKAEDGTTYVFIVYSIRHIEGESYLLNSTSMLSSLIAPDGSKYKTYPEVILAARDENGIDSNEYIKDESSVRKATGFCVPKKWIDDNATFYIGREYEENIPIKFGK